MTLTELFTNIADAIRTKKGTSDKILASDFATEIENLPSGGDIDDYYTGTLTSNTSASASFIVQNIKQIPKLPLTSTSCENLFNNCISLITIPLLDTSKSTNFKRMFQSCTSLTSIPLLNTSKGTNFYHMFGSCTSLTSIPLLDTSKGTNFYGMFSSCTSLTSIPLLDTSKGTDFSYMFIRNTNLTEIPQLNTSKGTNFTSMFNYCTSLTSIPLLDTSKGTNFYGMFSMCKNLTEIPQLNTSNGTNFYQMFHCCENVITIPQLDASKAIKISQMFNKDPNYIKNYFLTNFGGLLNIGKAYTKTSNNYSDYVFTLSYATNLTHDSLMNVINNLYDLNLTYNVANGGTLYTQQLNLGSTNKAKLTAEEIAIATAKGWTIL